MYCRTCGKEGDEKAFACKGCGFPPRKGEKFCPHCGAGDILSGQVICIKCKGSLAAVSGKKNQTASKLPTSASGKKNQTASKLPIIFLGIFRLGASGLCKLYSGFKKIVCAVIGKLTYVKTKKIIKFLSLVVALALLAFLVFVLFIKKDESIKTIRTPKYAFIGEIGFTSNGERFATAGRDGIIRVWGTSTGECIKELAPKKNEKKNGSLDELPSIEAISFTPDDKLILSGGRDSDFFMRGSVLIDEYYVSVWDVSSGELVTKYKGGAKPISSIDIRADGKHAALGTESGTSDGHGVIRLVDTKTGYVRNTIYPELKDVRLVKFCPKGQYLLSAHYSYDLDSGSTLVLWKHLEKQVNSWRWRKRVKGKVWDAEFDSEGQRIVGVSTDGNIMLWDVATGDLIKTIATAGILKGATQIRFAGKDKYVVCSGYNGGLAVFNLESGECVKKLKGQKRVAVLALDSSKTQLLTAGVVDDKIKLWDLTEIVTEKKEINDITKEDEEDTETLTNSQSLLQNVKKKVQNIADEVLGENEDTDTSLVVEQTQTDEQSPEKREAFVGARNGAQQVLEQKTSEFKRKSRVLENNTVYKKDVLPLLKEAEYFANKGDFESATLKYNEYSKKLEAIKPKAIKMF